MLGWELSPPIGASNTYGARNALESSFMPRIAHTQAPRAAAYTNAHLNNNLDLLPPGVRDNVANPSLFATTLHRTNLFDAQHTVNNAPIPNWEEQSDMITSPQAQRLGAYWWDVLQGSYLMDRAGWVERGQFSVPKTGFTAFRHLKPHSTRQFV